jgi:hypothetical protein
MLTVSVFNIMAWDGVDQKVELESLETLRVYVFMNNRQNSYIKFIMCLAIFSIIKDVCKTFLKRIFKICQDFTLILRHGVLFFFLL